MKKKIKKREVFKHSFTNGSVLLILGSLFIGLVADAKQAEGIKPFTNDLFKGFLAIFLLDMGITSGKKLKAFFSFGLFPFLFAFFIPLINGVIFAYISSMITSDVSNRFVIAILAASASYIAVPAAMKISVPKICHTFYDCLIKKYLSFCHVCKVCMQTLQTSRFKKKDSRAIYIRNNK